MGHEISLHLVTDLHVQWLITGWERGEGDLSLYEVDRPFHALREMINFEWKGKKILRCQHFFYLGWP